MGVRLIDKFESLDGTISYTFLTNRAEHQIEQMYRTPISSGVGANYAHDHLGNGVSPKDPRRITVRGLLYGSTATALETALDEATSEIERIGKGWLYRLDVDGTTYRRCLARPLSAPSVTFNETFQFGVMPTAFSFLGLSDWQSITATTGSQTIDTANESVTINNTGNVNCYAVTFRLRNNGTTRATSPVLFNTTTGQMAVFLRSMNVADHELYYETSARLVQFSTNNGAAYSNDYSNFAGTGFYLKPGNNVLKVCCGRPHMLPWLNTIRVPNFDLEWSFYPCFS